MAHFWFDDQPGWSILRLDSEAYALVADAQGFVARVIDGEQEPSRGFHVQRVAGDAGGAGWAVIGTPADLRVNGTVVCTGLRLLADRDELRLAGSPGTFFSAEDLATVVAFPHEEAVICPRCKLPIEHAQPAVCCPDCHVWHHQDEAKDLPCWTFGPQCQACPQPTDLEAGFRWTPHDL